ncbi:MAG: aminopeptidase, partial [Bacteroidales bacterium]|nr:aminopeptidase [Bacteroidales bacterium]
MKKIKLFPVLLLVPVLLWAQGQKTEFLSRLEAVPGMEVVGEVRHNPQFKEAYEIRFTQPVDHHHPEGATFTQRMFIGHVGYDRPMVLSTSGYGAGGLGFAEPAQLLKANLIRVEHRYFGKSAPVPPDWKYLTVWQAASDHHEIVHAFRKLYQGPWISTGHSKDGQTTIMFKAFYPGDIDVAIPYVAPLNTSKVDPRIFTFLEHVGTQEERDKALAYQITMFERKKELLPLAKKWADAAGWTFTMGLDRAYDLAVLEFPFAMWQYGRPDPMTLPAKDASPEELMKAMKATNALFYFSEPGIKVFLPHYYQAMTEMGYYGYD